MSKRGPTSELNHDNWDQDDPEDDEEVRGGFQQAAPEELQKRVIKVAKRRSINPNTTINSPFVAFTGFKTFKPPSSGTPTFTFVTGTGDMKNGHTEETGTKKDEEMKVETKPTEEKEVPKSNTSKSFDDFVKPNASGSSQTPKTGINKADNSESSPDYYSHLKSLNLSVASWITKHLNDNPYCILLPVFKDYEKHLDNITKNYPMSSSEDDTPGAPETKEVPKAAKIKLEATKPTTKLFQSVTNSDSSENEAKSEPATTKAPLFTSIASSPTSSTTSSSSASLMFKLPSSSDSPNSETSNKSEKTIPASLTTETPTVAKTPAESFFTPLNQTPATTATPNNFQTPALTTPSLFGNLKSGNLFGGTGTAGENKTFNPSSLTFSFGNTTTAQSSDTSKSTFSSSVPAFGSTTSAPVFTFGGGTGMGVFGSGTGGGLFGGPPTGGGTLFNLGKNNTQEQTKKEDDDAESEEPPKVEFNPIKEDDAVYEITCKVYVRKDGEYKDRGKGQLYIKKVASGKSQLLARAATTTGQILLNVILNSSVTVSKPTTGKNSVIIMCIPLPKEDPTAVLIRVKTQADADELLAKLEEHKQPTAEEEPEK